ncbi:MAG: PhoX family phosphatase [Granulosicoccus sp.]
MSKATFDPTRYNLTSNTPFSSILEREISRRKLLKRGCGMTALSMFGGLGLSGCSTGDDPVPMMEGTDGGFSTELGFSSIAGARLDAVVVPEGYTAQVLAPWGTPLNSQANTWLEDGSNTSDDQLNAVGMHHDGMHFFPIDGSVTDGLLCINHEYIDTDALHPNGSTVDESTGLRVSAEEVRKEINAHGVTVVRVRLVAGQWEVVVDDPLNRRFTGATEMSISGPLRGNSLLVTPYALSGDRARGTLNNCGNGHTPWGTYLTCEENWPGYFINVGVLTADQERIGLSDEGTRYGWETVAANISEQDSEFSRFDVTETGADSTSDYRNEANGHGYITEIDPYNAQSLATKRTALGRYRHESCVFGKLVEGQPVVFYSGHDARFEYVYKFVSTASWDPADATPDDRLLTGSKYLDDGELFVARFDEGGQGEWLALTLDSPALDGSTLSESFVDLAAILINAPGAADLLGATPMDRPEWIAVSPVDGAVYVSLTNNTRRTGETTETDVNPANPRLDNEFGHIIRWVELADNQFSWDIFLFGAPAAGDVDVNLSGLTDLNQFASPDGMAFDPRGILWVQTDNGADAVKEETNDQMLAVIPSTLMDEDGNPDVVNASNQTQLKRFFVGPNDCEVTGVAFTGDYQNFFVNIQHPGNWPSNVDATIETQDDVTLRPRAATVAIRRIDGGAVGV